MFSILLLVPLLLATYGNDMTRDDHSCVLQTKVKTQHDQNKSSAPCTSTSSPIIGGGLQINLEAVHVHNKCKLGVYMGKYGEVDTLYLTQNQEKDLSSSEVAAFLTERLTASLANEFTGQAGNNEIYSEVELLRGFPNGLGMYPQQNFNFKGQYGWNGLNILLAMEKSDGSGLVCTDGKAWTNFGDPTIDCNFPDNSGIITYHTFDSLNFAACKSAFVETKESCTAYQAIYLTDNSVLVTAADPDGTKSARSCGLNSPPPNAFKQAVFADGHVCTTTLRNAGRENGGKSATCECFEDPCANGKPLFEQCMQSQEYVPVGNQGFFTCELEQGLPPINTKMLIEFSCDSIFDP